MFIDVNYKECICFQCEGLRKAIKNKTGVDCACDMGPFYCPEQCNKCTVKNKCDVPKNPKGYIWKDLCDSCNNKCEHGETNAIT